jgi:hypothetical protein
MLMIALRLEVISYLYVFVRFFGKWYAVTICNKVGRQCETPGKIKETNHFRTNFERKDISIVYL